MAPRKPTSLENLAFASLSAYLSAVFNHLLQSDSMTAKFYANLCQSLKELLYGITAPLLHERVANVCLEALDKGFLFRLPAGPPSSKARKIAHHFAKLLVGPQLRRVDRNVSYPVADVLFSSLEQLTRLEELHCAAFWTLIPQYGYHVALLEEKLRSSFESLKYLTFFSAEAAVCNNEIVEAITEYCPELRTLIADSPEVTDACVGALCESRNLMCVDVAAAGVTGHGLLQLLARSKSRALTHVVLGRHRSQVLKLVKTSEEYRGRTFLQEELSFENKFGKLKSRQISKQLKTACKFFPSLRVIKIHCYRVPDLRDLQGLRHLEKLELDIQEFAGTSDRLVGFLEARGSCLTSLMVESEEVSDGVLRAILAHCRSLQELLVKFFPYYYTRDLPVGPLTFISADTFKRLGKFSVWGSPFWFTGAILRNAQNLEYLQLKTLQENDEPNLNEVFESVLEVNPLKRVENLSLYGDLPKSCLEKMIKECEVLGRINYIPKSQQEFGDLQKFIEKNNYDVLLLDGNKAENRNLFTQIFK